MSPYTLVVVDMQVGYKPTEIRQIIEVSNQIKKAMSDGAGIIILEFWYKYFNGTIKNPMGDTIQEISSLVVGYEKARTVKKFECSGEMAICDFLNENPDWNRENLTICGIFTDQCVRATVSDLISRVPTIKIEIPMGACWTRLGVYVKNKLMMDYFLENNLDSLDNPFHMYPKSDRITYK